jgi:[ribosomal protein S5]-alanine N-acetyltransferase
VTAHLSSCRRCHWASRALVAHAFEQPQFTRLFAPIHAGNTRSMRVAQKAGFALEGIQRQGAMKAGRAIDRHVFARGRSG